MNNSDAAKIIFQAEQLRPEGVYSSAPPRAYIAAIGASREAVEKDAAEKATQQGCDPSTITAITLYNTRRDWETIFGPVEPHIGFRD